MSTDLVNITTNTSIAPAVFGGSSVFGGASSSFRVKPAQVELMQKTSRAEGALEGKFRNSLTGEHYDSIHAVLIFDPTKPRSMYENDNEFGVPPVCYSMDGITPSDNAANAQALRCATCRHSDWSRWKKNGKKREDIPKCKERRVMFLVDRSSKIPYKLTVRGKSVSEYQKAMDTIAGLAELYLAQHGHYPELHDFSFKITTIRKVDAKGVYYVMVFDEIGLIREEDRAAFGALYQKFLAQRQEYASAEEAEKADEDVDSEMGEASAKPPVVEAKVEPKAEAKPKPVVTI